LYSRARRRDTLGWCDYSIHAGLQPGPPGNAGDARCSAARGPDDGSSEHPLREVAQQQLLVAPALPQALERGVDHVLERDVAALDGDADAIAEILGLNERPASELAACLRGGAVEPERQADAVIEQQVDRAGDERVARQLHRLVGPDRAVAEEGAQVGLVRR